MDIFDHNGKKIRLTEQQFIAEGGEGKLFAYKGTMFKIYHELSDVIPEEKLSELMRLDNTAIVRPTGSVVDTNGRRIGYSMNQLSNTISLARLFTSHYQQSVNFTVDKAIVLIRKMQEVIGFIHRQGFLQVDGNEFNYLASPAGVKVWFIDVDSYQTPTFPAKVIMPSIRDYTQSEFNEGSDWFSFAIIAFQILTGIHPFKGRHPDFKRGDFKGRIRAGVSVLNPQVTYPGSVRDFSLIPKEYMDWFQLMFSGRDRIPAPDGRVLPVVGVVVPGIEIRDGKQISIRKLAGFGTAIRHVNWVNGQRIIQTVERLYVGNHEYEIPGDAKGLLMIEGTPWYLKIQHGLLELVSGDNPKEKVASSLAAEQVVVAHNTAYVRYENRLTEVSVINMGGRLLMAAGNSRAVLPSLMSFGSLFIENAMGAIHLMIPETGGRMAVVRVKELDGWKIIDAGYERQVAMVSIANKQGEYRQAVIRFSEGFDQYDCRIIETDVALNFTVTERNMLVAMYRDGEIEVSSIKPGSKDVRIIEDSQIVSAINLVNDAGRVGGFAGDSYFSLAVK